MGKITDISKKYNKSIQNSRTSKKESFEIRNKHFVKDFANLTFNPNFHNRYKLNKRYRNLQLGSRVTIAALVAFLGLGIGVSTYNSLSR